MRGSGHLSAAAARQCTRQCLHQPPKVPLRPAAAPASPGATGDVCGRDCDHQTARSCRPAGFVEVDEQKPLRAKGAPACRSRSTGLAHGSDLKLDLMARGTSPDPAAARRSAARGATAT
eukprot:21332-Prymnesium_polylepis.1